MSWANSLDGGQLLNPVFDRFYGCCDGLKVLRLNPNSNSNSSYRDESASWLTTVKRFHRQLLEAYWDSRRKHKQTKRSLKEVWFPHKNKKATTGATKRNFILKKPPQKLGSYLERTGSLKNFGKAVAAWNSWRQILENLVSVVKKLDASKNFNLQKNLGEVKICGEVVWKKFCFQVGIFKGFIFMGTRLEIWNLKEIQCKFIFDMLYKIKHSQFT